MLPSFCFATFQQHLNANRAVRCPASAAKLLTLRSFARGWARSHFRPFRHFSRNFNVQRESSVIDLLRFAHRRYTHTRTFSRIRYTIMATACALAPRSSSLRILICLLLRHGMFARSLIRVCLYPRSSLRSRSCWHI